MEENNTNKSVMHIVSLVLGIISIVTALFWYITIPTGISIGATMVRPIVSAASTTNAPSNKDAGSITL